MGGRAGPRGRRRAPQELCGGLLTDSADGWQALKVPRRTAGGLFWQLTRLCGEPLTGADGRPRGLRGGLLTGVGGWLKGSAADCGRALLVAGGRCGGLLAGAGGPLGLCGGRPTDSAGG
ncbi:hypothetical protein GCM10010501_35640 [Streptomyces libani subsp. rufus]|nr:hypothetical protein GCM10010501_35640 [Streptomyces libani subsp. rufus]